LNLSRFATPSAGREEAYLHVLPKCGKACRNNLFGLNGIGSGDAKQVLNNLGAFIAELAFPKEQMEELVQSVAASYRADGGATLLRDAFGPET